MIFSPRPARYEIWVGLLILTLLALLVRVPLIDRGPNMDELYHLFAAKSWLAEGELRIADGVYTRAEPYTKLVAWAFALFGESLEVMRMVGVIASGLTVIALFLWTRSVAGLVAAWIAALLFALWPDGIAVAVYNRFYAPHGLLFWLGAISVYLLIEQRAWWHRGWLLALAVAAVLCFAMATILQMTTLIGVAGVLMWVALVIGLPWLTMLDVRSRLLVIGALIVAGIAGLGFVIASPFGADLLDTFRWTPDWAAEYRNQFWFYHALLSLYYPTLWSLFGIAILVAMAYRPKPVAFCLCIFGPAFLLHSLGGMKHLRYLYYVMPALFVIWGIALAHVWERVAPFLVEVTDKTLDFLAPGLPRRPLRVGLIAAALGFTIFANAATIKTAAMLAGVTVPPMTEPPDWQAARATLAPWLRDDDTLLVTTSEMETLYTFDRYDILISNSRMSELTHDSGRKVGEFGIDRRTGRAVISEASSVELIMDCFPKGVILSNVYRWRDPAQLDDEVAKVIEARAIPIDMPPSSRMVAYRWETPTPTASPACAELAAGYPTATISKGGQPAARPDQVASDEVKTPRP